MKKAVAYVRVSTKSDAQLHSFEYQYEYWEKEIKDTYKCEFVGIYADRGVSGRSLSRRPEQLKMLEDAKKHKFDLIYVKSVSRFARNTTELLTTIRELRDEGIGVFFEREQIDTLSPTSELFLTIAAAVAENDLKIYSDNKRWAYNEKFKNGYVCAGSRIYGYKMNNETNTLEIVPEEAKIVKRIFDLCIKGYGNHRITQLLESEGIKNPLGNDTWEPKSISYILTNEKYKGDSLQQKYICILNVKKVNKGERPQYYVENTHEPIVSKEVWEKANEIRKERIHYNSKPIDIDYAFTGMIRCPICGKHYMHKIISKDKPWRREEWRCDTYDKKGKSYCDNTTIKDAVLKELFIEAYNKFIKSLDTKGKMNELRIELERLVGLETELNQLRVNKLITPSQYNSEIDSIRDNIREINSQISDYELRNIDDKDKKQIKKFDPEKVYKFLDYIEIKHHRISFIFINGVVIKKEYTNGPSGNQKGWMKKKEDRICNKQE